MLINNFKFTSSKTHSTISFDVKANSDRRPHNVWYKFENNKLVSSKIDASVALAAFLIPCMKIGENLEIEGCVSKKLIVNSNKIMDLFHSWNIGFNKINISCNQNKTNRNTTTSSASFFSLGVDSFYTYLKHKTDKVKINNLIFVHGFDIDLDNKLYFSQSLKRLRSISQEEKINVIPVVTNIKRISDKYVEWDWEHGGAMASISVLLSGRFNRIYFAGSDSWTQRKKTMPYGTHPNLDGLWSTEILKVIHDGNEATRLQKIQNIVSKSSIALKHLRVCNQNLKNTYNCSNCEKCLRTMIDLEISDVLTKSATFAHTIPLARLSKIHNEDFDTKYYFEDSLKELRRQNKRPDLQNAIIKSLYLSNHPTITTRLIKYLSNLDKKYNNHTIFNYIFSLNGSGDRKLIFKILSKINIIR